MGSRRIERLCATILVLVLSGVCASAATPKKRLWKMVPGYPTVFVDMNSIVARKLEYVPPRDENHGVSMPIDTEVDVRLNGEMVFSWLNCIPVPWVTMEKDNAGPFYADQRLVGYIPDKAIMAMVCPLRKRMQP